MTMYSDEEPEQEPSEDDLLEWLGKELDYECMYVPCSATFEEGVKVGDRDGDVFCSLECMAYAGDILVGLDKVYFTVWDHSPEESALKLGREFLASRHDPKKERSK